MLIVIPFILKSAYLDNKLCDYCRVNAKVTDSVGGGAIFKEVNSRALIPWLSPWKTIHPISYTYQGVTQKMKFREAWEDHTQMIETLSL